MTCLCQLPFKGTLPIELSQGLSKGTLPIELSQGLSKGTLALQPDSMLLPVREHL